MLDELVLELSIRYRKDVFAQPQIKITTNVIALQHIDNIYYGHIAIEELASEESLRAATFGGSGTSIQKASTLNSLEKDLDSKIK